MFFSFNSQLQNLKKKLSIESELSIELTHNAVSCKNNRMKKRKKRKGGDVRSEIGKRSRMEMVLEWINEGSRSLGDIEHALREIVERGEKDEDTLIAKYHLAALCLQTNRRDEGVELAREIGFRYVIQSDIWQTSGLMCSSGESFVGAVDGILSSSRFDSLYKIFAPDSSFWSEHSYPTPNFFSYYVSLKDKKRNLLSDIVRNNVIPVVSETFPEAKNVVGYEVWSHKRSNGSGHQMHYDTDEVVERTGQISHPVVSCVLYLQEGHGGATLVTTHRLKDSTLEEASGFLLRPKTNRLCYFDGRLLHGVVPKMKQFETRRQHGKRKRSRVGVAERITLMIGLWTKTPQSAVEAKKRRDDDRLVPCMEIPRHHRWTTMLRRFSATKEKSHNHKKLNKFEHVKKLWQKIKKSTKCIDDSLARSMFSVGGFLMFDLNDLDRALIEGRGIEEEKEEEEWLNLADFI